MRQKQTDTWVTVTCAVCGKTFEKRACWAKRTQMHYCSRQCNGVHRGQEWKTHAYKGRQNWTEASAQSYRGKMTGEQNPAWKGGVTFFKKKGNYKDIPYVRAPEWAKPMARQDGYIMQHRLVMAQIVGRLLARTEVVHHVNHDPADNRPENLELWPNNSSHKSAEWGKSVPGAANLWFPKPK